MSQQTSNHSFDELASGLASGTLSRGKALKLMGAALLGGTLASLGIREAAAAPRIKCTSDADCPSGGTCVSKGGNRFCACGFSTCVTKCGKCAGFPIKDFICVNAPGCPATYACVVPCRA